MGVEGIQKLIEFKDIKGEKVILKKLSVSDVTQRYVDWLNDKEANAFLSVRDVSQDIDMVREYVSSYENRDDKLLLGIFEKNKVIHLGNITFSSIEWENKLAWIGISIGDKNYWKKGLATEALSLVADFAFSKLKLHKLKAGIEEENLPSQKLFKKVGFVQESKLQSRLVFVLENKNIE